MTCLQLPPEYSNEAPLPALLLAAGASPFPLPAGEAIGSDTSTPQRPLLATR